MIAFVLSRRKLFNSLQIVAITVAIALSLVAYSASTNLVSSWENSLPENAPNNLLFNVYEGEKEQLLSFLKENKIDINRKVLADMAMNVSENFSKLVKSLK